MIKLKVTRSPTLERKLAKALKEGVDNAFESNMEETMAALVEATPIDTGYARSRWENYRVNEFRVSLSLVPFSVKFTEAVDVVQNDADYIQFLNQGSSKQAPAFFIEKTFISRGYLPTIIK